MPPTYNARRALRRPSWLKSAIVICALVGGFLLALSLVFGGGEHLCPGPGKTAREFHLDYIDCMDGRPLFEGRSPFFNREYKVNHCMIAKGHVIQRGWCDRGPDGPPPPISD